MRYFIYLSYNTNFWKTEKYLLDLGVKVKQIYQQLITMKIIK